MNGSARAPDPAVDVRVLGRIVLVESALHALPDRTRIVQFLCEGLRAVPGVAGTALCAERHVVYATDGWGRPPGPCEAGDDCAACVRAGTGLDAVLLPLRTVTADHGNVVLAVRDRAALAPYVPFLSNLANVAAVSVENRAQQRALGDLNAELSEKVRQLEAVQAGLRRAQHDLEETVAARTAELQRANASLRESEARLLLAQEAANVGTWEWLPREGTVAFSGRSAGTFGTASGEAVPLARVLASIHPDDVPALRETMRRALAEGTSVDARFRVPQPGGDVRWLNVVGRPDLDADGQAWRVVGIDLDVTERKRLEEGLLQASKLESIGRLAGGIAHDFNNLLTVILSTSGALRDDLAQGRSPRVEDVEEIETVARRAADLTRQLLAFARKQVVEPTALDLNALVAGMAGLLRRVLTGTIELRVVPFAGLWTVRCDRSQLEQVVLNLAVNARDAMPRGGTLWIETHNVPRDGGASQRGPPDGTEWVALRVRDTGVGLGPEAKARLFEPFFTTKAPGKGTGLGLATSYGIVQQAGGEILVESEPGRGATFEVRLPRWTGAEPVVGALAAAPRRAAARGTETLLVVEDEPAVREVAVGALRAAGFTVRSAGSGAEALDALERLASPPALLITDVMMPGMDGRELVSRARERHPGLRALLVSGYFGDAGAPDAGLAAPLPLLPKPFTPAILVAKVRELLDGA